MIPDFENFENRVERDRRDRERDLLALLLSLFGLARKHAFSAARIGADVRSAVADVLMGNPQLNLPGLSGRLSQQLQLATEEGFHRSVLAVPGDSLLLPDDYLSRARQYTVMMLTTLLSRIANEQQAAQLNGDTAQQAVSRAFTVWGYTKGGDNGPWQLTTNTETMVVGAFGDGLWMGWQRPEAQDVITGFRHVSVLDEVTTDICRSRDGLQLPASDPYWLTGQPPLHFSCRSLLLPLTGAFDISTTLPDVPHDPRFGAAPPGFPGSAAA